jgi:UDPglucose 6-dehydrogenase/GDP-mannose 6-dehydrogenase
VAQGTDLYVPMPMLRSVLEINAAQPDRLVELVRKHIPDLSGKKVAVLGIAFKPDTDDTRESPAFPVLRKLAALGATLAAYDPIARPVGHDSLAGLTLANSVEEAVKDADAVVLITRWPEFNELASLLRRLGRRPLVVDGRRVLNPDDFDLYEGIGWRKLGDAEK